MGGGGAGGEVIEVIGVVVSSVSAIALYASASFLSFEGPLACSLIFLAAALLPAQPFLGGAFSPAFFPK